MTAWNYRARRLTFLRAVATDSGGLSGGTPLVLRRLRLSDGRSLVTPYLTWWPRGNRSLCCRGPPTASDSEAWLITAPQRLTICTTGGQASRESRTDESSAR